MNIKQVGSLFTICLISLFIACNLPVSKDTKPDTSNCVNTKYYNAGYKMGKYSRNMAPDENYTTYGIEYYRLQDGITKDDPNAPCYDEGFMDGKMGR
jgi:hypothetical protein